LLTLNGGSTSEEIDASISAVADKDKVEFLKGVFVLLRSGNVDGAKAHVDLRRGKITPIEDVDPLRILEVADGERVRRIPVGSPEYERWLREFEKRSSWEDWFLFMHPEQEQIVKADYPGVTNLSGVSGSGKTCVAVRRAMRLAEADSARVLILTLNRSLAGLLRQLVRSICVESTIVGRIEVTSFFDLAQTLLMTFEPKRARHYQDITWKLKEHVDEIFREYYRQWTNNTDASVLLPFHKSLTARSVCSEAYVCEEFDWIRSAVGPGDRKRYLDLERRGRKFPVLAERRRSILRGLHLWERKMKAVGVIDYLGLTSALSKHVDQIGPLYTNVLVDEAQDFGTTELEVIRKLVKPGPNDLFLCGDIAQTVLPKDRTLSEAGIMISTRERIRQNYRNSREILAAAYALLKANLYEEMLESEDLEILDPRFANFSGPVPVALAAPTLEREIAYARAYADTRLDSGTRTVCVAFAGFSTRDVADFAQRLGVAALDGAYDPRTDRLVFADLEQTKGYEFDTIVIVNCCEGVLPAKTAPTEERFRDACKLYVAMTRAKTELGIILLHRTSLLREAHGRAGDHHSERVPEPFTFRFAIVASS
jgi:superfamily I DNA/RNA helicase